MPAMEFSSRIALFDYSCGTLGLEFIIDVKESEFFSMGDSILKNGCRNGGLCHELVLCLSLAVVMSSPCYLECLLFSAPHGNDTETSKEDNLDQYEYVNHPTTILKMMKVAWPSFH